MRQSIPETNRMSSSCLHLSKPLLDESKACEHNFPSFDVKRQVNLNPFRGDDDADSNFDEYFGPDRETITSCYVTDMRDSSPSSSKVKFNHTPSQETENADVVHAGRCERNSHVPSVHRNVRLGSRMGYRILCVALYQLTTLSVGVCITVTALAGWRHTKEDISFLIMIALHGLLGFFTFLMYGMHGEWAKLVLKRLPLYLVWTPRDDVGASYIGERNSTTITEDVD